jgi:DNA-binding response OmpR family regulator
LIPARILVVDDGAVPRALVRSVLEGAGMDVVEASDGTEGLRRFYECKPRLVVLDVTMPGLDGWEVLKRIRELSEVPVLMLTASARELEVVRGLREGADDYLTKPFGQGELIARIEALLRRSGNGSSEGEVYADELLEIDFPSRRVTVLGREVGLTPTEFKLLAILARHPNQVLSHDQLLELVWGESSQHSPNQVKLYVGYVRRKLREASDVNPIETVRGFGYRYFPGTPGLSG